MKVNFVNGKSIASQLSEVVSKTFPAIKTTGKAQDLKAIYSDAKSKGKAIIFVWRKATLRLTENLKVQELNFCNTYEDTQLSKEAAEMIVKCLENIPSVPTPEVKSQEIAVAA